MKGKTEPCCAKDALNLPDARETSEFILEMTEAALDNVGIVATRGQIYKLAEAMLMVFIAGAASQNPNIREAALTVYGTP